MALPNIPVSCGAADLKLIVYHGLLPQTITWLRGYDISKIHFTLRKKHWLEIAPPRSGPDVNAIADEFFKIKPGKAANSGMKFFDNKKPASLFLGIDNATYNDIQDHFERIDNPDLPAAEYDNQATSKVRTHHCRGRGMYIEAHMFSEHRPWSGYEKKGQNYSAQDKDSPDGDSSNAAESRLGFCLY